MLLSDKPAQDLKEVLTNSFTKVKNNILLDEQDIANLERYMGILYDDHGSILKIDKDCLLLKKIKLFLINSTGKEFLNVNRINVPNNISRLLNDSNLSKLEELELNTFVDAILSLSSIEDIVKNYAYLETNQTSTEILSESRTKLSSELKQNKPLSPLPSWFEEMSTDLKESKSKSTMPEWFTEMSDEVKLLQEKSTHKYEQIPTPDTSNFILVSMGNIGRIQEFLHQFPQSNSNEDHVGSIACSSTLIWSGIEGNNVPTELYRNLPFGFTLDPKKIIVPYAEFLASGTSSIVPIEHPKKFDSKHKDKMGRTLAKDEQHIIVNHAKWEHISSEKGHSRGIYHKIGSLEIFASNVWRKFHKRGKKSLNEALILQAGSENPINGIIIRADIFNRIDDNQKQELISILQNHPHLKMFIYDTRLNEHIVREADNNKAINFLRSKIGQKTLGTTESEFFKPFMGHDNIAMEAAAATSATEFLSPATAAVSLRRARTMSNEQTQQHDNHTNTYRKYM